MKPHHSGPPQMSFHTGTKIFFFIRPFVSRLRRSPWVLVKCLGAMTEGSREVLINLLSPTKSRRRWRISGGQSVHSRYLVLDCVFVDDDQRLRDRGGAHLLLLLLFLVFLSPPSLFLLTSLLAPRVGENYRHCVLAVAVMRFADLSRRWATRRCS